MTILTPRARRLGVSLAGVAVACTLAFPAAANAAAGSYSPNPHQWYFKNWSIQQDVWPVTQGAGVTVGLVDTGVQANLPDLQGVVKPGADTLSNSGNGETDYGPDGGHGTEMAELIAGQGIGSGQFGVNPVGIAPQAKILPVHAIDPSTTMTPVANGIKYAVDHGASVINLSLGSPAPTSSSCDPQLQDAISYALARNAIVVAASGDVDKGDTRPIEPATCAGVLAVGGVEQNGSVWRYSTPGPEISVAAPGDHVYVTSANGQQYSIESHGTSGASALVSAAAALIRSKYPSMPWYTVDQRLINTTVSTGGSKPNDGTGYGIINVNYAVNVAQHPVPASAPNPPYTRYQEWLKSTGQSSAGSGGQSTSPTSSSGSSILWIVVGVLVVLIIAAVIIIVAVSRGRNRRGPHGPQGPSAPGGYPPNLYAPQPGQYPQGQYPQSGPPAPPGQPQPQYPQPGPYSPPGQYPPPRQ